MNAINFIGGILPLIAIFVLIYQSLKGQSNDRS